MHREYARSAEPTRLSRRFGMQLCQFRLTAMPCTISGLHAYRCNNAHFFIVFGNQGTLKKSEPNERGSSLFL